MYTFNYKKKSSTEIEKKTINMNITNISIKYPKYEMSEIKKKVKTLLVLFGEGPFTFPYSAHDGILCTPSTLQLRLIHTFVNDPIVYFSHHGIGRDWFKRKCIEAALVKVHWCLEDILEEITGMPVILKIDGNEFCEKVYIRRGDVSKYNFVKQCAKHFQINRRSIILPKYFNKSMIKKNAIIPISIKIN